MANGIVHTSSAGAEVFEWVFRVFLNGVKMDVQTLVIGVDIAKRFTSLMSFISVLYEGNKAVAKEDILELALFERIDERERGGSLLLLCRRAGS